MKSITIHNIDNSLDELIREQAIHQGTSLNKTIKNLLRQSLGLSEDIHKKRRGEFLDFLGIWSKKDEKNFNQKTKYFEKVDNDDWL